MTLIYGLVDASTRRIYYIGQTERLDARMSAHGNPEYVILEECAPEAATAIEARWIAAFPEYALKNSSGVKAPESMIAAINRLRVDFSDKEVAKMLKVSAVTLARIVAGLGVSFGTRVLVTARLMEIE